MVKKFRPVLLSEETHERVRRVAFERRMSMKEVVEEALKNYYGWNNDSSKSKKEERNGTPKRGSPAG